MRALAPLRTKVHAGAAQGEPPRLLESAPCGSGVTVRLPLWHEARGTSCRRGGPEALTAVTLDSSRSEWPRAHQLAIQAFRVAVRVLVARHPEAGATAAEAERPAGVGLPKGVPVGPTCGAARGVALQADVAGVDGAGAVRHASNDATGGRRRRTVARHPVTGDAGRVPGLRGRTGAHARATAAGAVRTEHCDVAAAREGLLLGVHERVLTVFGAWTAAGKGHQDSNEIQLPHGIPQGGGCAQY